MLYRLKIRCQEISQSWELEKIRVIMIIRESIIKNKNYVQRTFEQHTTAWTEGESYLSMAEQVSVKFLLSLMGA